ncbi:MAG TPA: hypothetical protein ENJ68_01165, partial [Devosia sp.]|nr:hypothetical protein [Devosia sp.]
MVLPEGKFRVLKRYSFCVSGCSGAAVEVLACTGAISGRGDGTGQTWSNGFSCQPFAVSCAPMSSSSLDKAISSLDIPILIVNEEMEIVRANRAARRVFSRRLDGLPLHKATDSSKLAKAAAKALRQGKNQRVEIRVGEGRRLFLRAQAVRLSPDRAEEGRRVLISFEDVTQMHRVSKMRSDFVANVSHELRSPLTSLYGFIETLRNNPEIAEEDRDRFYDLMENEAQRMVRLIDELLTLSILQAETELDLNETVDMAALVG